VILSHPSGCEIFACGRTCGRGVFLQVSDPKREASGLAPW